MSAARFKAEPLGTPAGADRVDDAHLKLVDETKVRDRIVETAWALYKRRFKIPYSQARPSILVKLLALIFRVTRSDCSGFVAACMYRAGVLPHVDWRYTNTWVQIKLGRWVGLHHAKPGDVVFYGAVYSRKEDAPADRRWRLVSFGRVWHDPTHEALYVGDGKVVSDGHFPISVFDVDYRPDRLQVRSFV